MLAERKARDEEVEKKRRRREGDQSGAGEDEVSGDVREGGEASTENCGECEGEAIRWGNQVM